MYTVSGPSVTPGLLKRAAAFARQLDLTWEDGMEYTCLLMEERNDDPPEILACGSLDHGILKCIAVAPAHQGEDLSARILTDLVTEAHRRGVRHLMLYTKPRNRMLFAPLGFSPVVRTPDVLLMENEPDGLNRYLRSLSRPEKNAGVCGAVVANCNPVTDGHLHLIRAAAGMCDTLHLFILSEDRSLFPADTRMLLVRQALEAPEFSDIRDRIYLHPTGTYMVSSATFPSYFLKDAKAADAVHCELDLVLFGERIAPELGITRRFAGTEPYSAVTRAYNEQMKQTLPRYGIELIEIPRLEDGSGAISASRVRACLEKGGDPRTLPVPECVRRYLERNRS